jgi:hypothetical protein
MKWQLQILNGRALQLCVYVYQLVELDMFNLVQLWGGLKGVK